jgi:hypothetical protein
VGEAHAERAEADADLPDCRAGVIGLRNLTDAEREMLKMLATLRLGVQFHEDQLITDTLTYLISKGMVSKSDDEFYRITDNGMWAIGIDPAMPVS